MRFNNDLEKCTKLVLCRIAELQPIRGNKAACFLPFDLSSWLWSREILGAMFVIGGVLVAY